ncbi:MAG: hypothetical protein Q8R32_01440 [bacterium]|nr:hypothetical protein [bacterium]
MFGYFRNLPDQSLPVRRRFVVFATAFSFALIVLLWVGVVAVGRRSAPTPTPSLGTEGELPEAPLLVSPSPALDESFSPGTLPDTSPSPTVPVVDYGQISTSLLRAFGSPSPNSP